MLTASIPFSSASWTAAWSTRSLVSGVRSDVGRGFGWVAIS